MKFIDLELWGQAAEVYRKKTGRLLTFDEYLAMTEAKPAPFLSAVLAADYAQANAEAEDCATVEREENQIAPRDQDNWHNGGQR